MIPKALVWAPHILFIIAIYIYIYIYQVWYGNNIISTSSRLSPQDKVTDFPFEDFFLSDARTEGLDLSNKRKNQPTNQPNNEATEHTTKQLNNERTNQPTNQPTYEPIN
jgi:hypothetical protein